MLELVSKAEAIVQANLDSADDAWLELWIPIVSESIAGWLKQPWRLYVLARTADGKLVLGDDGLPVATLDEEGNPVVHPSVRGAALLELSSQFRFREGEGDNTVDPASGHGHVLSRGATVLLTPLRRPTVA